MSSGQKWWKPVLNRSLDFVFTSFCSICNGRVFKDGYSYSCQECLDSLAWVRGTRCKLCGVSMSGMGFKDMTCVNCREENLLFEEGRCMFLMEERSKNLVHDLKYYGARMILRDMTSWLDRCPGYEDFLEGSFLIPVPLHQRRYSSRGFNQSVWIARAFKKSIGSGVEVCDLLARKKNTPTQTVLNRNERKANVKNAFALKPKNCLKKEDRIVLIDDVFTTGATLNACAQTLRNEGFVRIDVATLGHG